MSALVGKAVSFVIGAHEEWTGRILADCGEGWLEVLARVNGLAFATFIHKTRVTGVEE